MRKRFWKGLRAIEVSIVLFIIFIICAVVIARYPEFKCRAMQSEAKFSLHEVYAAQMHFHSEHHHYATLDKLINKDARIKLLQKYYVLEDRIEPTDDRFSILATGLDGTLVAGEQWTVNEFNDVRLMKKVCNY